LRLDARMLRRLGDSTSSAWGLLGLVLGLVLVFFDIGATATLTQDLVLGSAPLQLARPGRVRGQAPSRGHRRPVGGAARCWRTAGSAGRTTSSSPVLP
jgi:hypothetical protein